MTGARRRRTTIAAPGLRLGVALALVLVVVSGCRDARELTDEQVDAVRVGSPDILTGAESDFVARTDGRSGEIRDALIDFFDAFEIADVDAMEGAVETVTETVAAFTLDLAAQNDPSIVETYRPYATAWQRVVDSLEGMAAGVVAGDPSGIEASARLYDRSIGEITALDALQVQRLRPLLGDDQLRSLLRGQGVDPATFGLSGEPAA